MARVRRVRTPEGAAKFGQPIESIIKSNRHARSVLARLGEQMSLFGDGDQATLSDPAPDFEKPRKPRTEKLRSILEERESKPLAAPVAAPLVPVNRLRRNAIFSIPAATDDDEYQLLTMSAYDMGNVHISANRLHDNTTQRFTLRAEQEVRSHDVRDPIPTVNPVAPTYEQTMADIAEGGYASNRVRVAATLAEHRWSRQLDVDTDYIIGMGRTRYRIVGVDEDSQTLELIAVSGANAGVQGRDGIDPERLTNAQTRQPAVQTGGDGLATESVLARVQRLRDERARAEMERQARLPGVGTMIRTLDDLDYEGGGRGTHTGATAFGSELNAPQSVNDMARIEEMMTWGIGRRNVEFKKLEGMYGGLELRNVKTTARDNTATSMKFTGDAYLGEEKVGLVTRSMSYDAAGNLKVHNDYLTLNGGQPPGKGKRKGFASNLYPAFESWYRRSGVTYIDIDATLEDGAYTWALAGFTWRPQHPNPENIVHSMRNAANDPDMPAVDQQRLIAMADKFVGGFANTTWPHPRDIATFTDSNGKGWGRSILRQQGWSGVKIL